MYQHLIQILSAVRLISRHQGATIKNIMEGAKVSRRTVYRIRDALEELGYPIYDMLDGHETVFKQNEERDQLRWWLPLPKPCFNLEDRIMLDYLFQEAAKSPALAEKVRNLRQKIALLVADGGYSLVDKKKGSTSPVMNSTPVLLHAAPLNKRINTDNEAHLETLFEAINIRKVCIVGYEAASSGIVKTYRVHPLALFEHDGGLYVFVLVPYYGDIRILALERFRSIDLTDDHFEPPDSFNAAALLSDPFGIVFDEPITARIKFSKNQARYIKEREWPSDAAIAENPDGSITLSLKTAGAYELKRWVMSYGSDAELLEPESLRSEVASELANAAACYIAKPDSQA